jgi:prevent-host-death family protein
MTTYTFSEARQKLSSVLDRARKEGEVLISRKDGSVFAIKPVTKSESPLDVEGVELSLSAQEIVDYVREVLSIMCEK